MLSRIKRCCKGVFQSLIGANMANEKQGKFWREEKREERKKILEKKGKKNT